MCIVQDIVDAMGTEIGKMNSIYSNAYVTISASCASNYNAGFLYKRPGYHSFKVPFGCLSGGIDFVNFTIESMPGDSIQFEKFRELPLNSRAWVFQESFLSRRMLIYGQFQVFWVCGITWGHDGGYISREYFFDNRFASKELSTHSLKDPKYLD
jgi:hypothetical protein